MKGFKSKYSVQIWNTKSLLRKNLGTTKYQTVLKNSPVNRSKLVLDTVMDKK